MFSNDSTPPEPPSPSVSDQLPSVRNVEIVRVIYKRPLIRFHGGKEVQHRQAVELIVETENELPACAVTPALFVGEHLLTDFEMTEDGRYRFFAFDEEELKEGAPIRLGWPDDRSKPQESGFTFKVNRESSR